MNAREILLKYGKGNFEHMFELDRLYPEIGILGPQCISADVRKGWRDLLIPCLEALRAEGCKVNQIKQKFGGLRLYWQYPDHIEAALDEWRKIPSETRVDWPLNSSPVWLVPIPFEDEMARIDRAVKPVIEEAERVSFLTCEHCGGVSEYGVPKMGSQLCVDCSKRQ